MTAAHAGQHAVRADPESLSKRDLLADWSFLGAAIVASVVFYLGGLGFYYDDYSILERMHGSSEQSLPGLYEAVRPAAGQRPLQAAIFAVLYELFGLSPLGYHVVNAGLLIAVALLFYLVLRELRLPRVVCVAVPLMYSMLPHYATTRFWFSVFSISLSTAFLLIALYAGLRALRASRRTVLLWLFVSIVGTIASPLAYEVVFPLFALNVGLVWWAARRSQGRAGPDRRRVQLTIGVLAAAAIGTGLLKTVVVAAHGQNSYGIGFQEGLLHHLVYLAGGAIAVNFGTYFVAFPYVLWWIVSHDFSLINALPAGATGLLTFAYLRRLGAQNDPFPARHMWNQLIGIGVVSFLLGYALFLTTPAFLFRSAGIDNRINAAASLGVAAMLVGGLGWLADRLRPARRVVVFSASTACVVACGAFVIQTLASFWIEAAERQRKILSAVLADADSIPDAGILILDGACPEVGPVPFFADENDLRNALRLRLGNRPLAADVAAEEMRVDDGMLAIDIHTYRSATRSYPLGSSLLVYDYGRRRLQRLRDSDAARRYIADRVQLACPRQRSFAWGFDTSRRWPLR